MQSEYQTARIFASACLMSLAAVGVGIADLSGSLNSVRTLVYDAMSPGRLILLSVGDRDAGDLDASSESSSFNDSPSVALTEESFDSEEFARLKEQLRVSELQRRELMIANARLVHEFRTTSAHARVADRLTADELTSTAAKDVDALIQQSGVSARVLRHGGLEGRIRDLLIDAGKAAGVLRSEIVVDKGSLLLEKGQRDDISRGDRVLSGAVVLGRVAESGQWVSSVQLVTDAEFSASAQIMRKTRQGIVYGAQGILRGNGDDTCELTGIASTEPVVVGDEVVTAEVDGVEGLRLYFGKITEASFQPGGQWKIQVQPEMLALMPLTQVQIIQTRLEGLKDTSEKSNTDSEESTEAKKRASSGGASR